MLYESIYIKCPEKGQFIETESRLAVSQAKHEGLNDQENGTRKLFGVKVIQLYKFNKIVKLYTYNGYHAT